MLAFYLAAFDNDDDCRKFEDIYQHFRETMFRVAFRVSGGNQAIAEDAVSEAFIQIIKDWDDFLEIPCNKQRSRIVIITKNKTIDLIRKEMKYTPQDDDVPGGDCDSVQSFLNYKEDTEYLSNCIGKMPEIYRIPLQLRFDQELTNAEIAAIIGIRANHVGVRIHRAISLLREIIDREKLNNG